MQLETQHVRCKRPGMCVVTGRNITRLSAAGYRWRVVLLSVDTGHRIVL
jgi:hypothetical protein